jgi:murein DD-endopeptidase MepM/ murein hydrolase activator NlpD
MPLSIATPDDLLPTPPTPPSSPNSPGKTPAMAAEAKKMTAADLYSPLPKAENEEFDEKALEDSISAVQEESRADLLTSPAKPENQNGEVPATAAMPPVTPPGEAARAWAAAREEIAGGRMSPITATVSTGSAVPAHQAHRAHQAGQADRPAADQSLEDLATALLKGEEAPMAAGQVQEQTRAQAQTSPPAPSIEPWQKAPGTKRPANLQGMSRQSPGPVSATPKPAQLFGRDRNKPRPAPESTSVAEPRGMAPKGTMWPLEGEGGLVSRFGWQADAASGKRRWNAGIEIAASPQAPVRAVLPGTVVYSGPRDGLGHTVVIEHKDGYRSYYGHLEPNAVKVGDKVRHGAEFAKLAAQDSSSTNEEKTASLHFEFKKGEMAINPESAIRRADNRNS